MIGGHDISFNTGSCPGIMDGAIRIVSAFWPHAILENAETAELLDSNFLGVRELPREVLIYECADARGLWATMGAAPENANQMVHMIGGVDSITIVVDNADSAEMSAMINAIRGYVYQDIFWMRAEAA